MATSLEKRIAALEQITGAAGECGCADRIRVIYAGQPEPPEVCPRCGKVRAVTLRVVYDDQGAADDSTD